MSNSIASIGGFTLADTLARERLKNKIDNPANPTAGQILSINQYGKPEWKTIENINNTSIKTIPFNFIDDTIYLNASELENNTIYK